VKCHAKVVSLNFALNELITTIGFAEHTARDSVIGLPHSKCELQRFAEQFAEHLSAASHGPS
jgi:hypothetical protein